MEEWTQEGVCAVPGYEEARDMEWQPYFSRGVLSGDMLLDLMGLKDRTELLIPLVVVRVCGISASVVNEEFLSDGTRQDCRVAEATGPTR